MQSFFLTENDRKHIFDDGYSGEYAKKLNLNGHGVGMYRAKQMLEKCGALLEINPGKSVSKNLGIEYAFNTITIKIPIDKEKPIK